MLHQMFYFDKRNPDWCAHSRWWRSRNRVVIPSKIVSAISRIEFPSDILTTFWTPLNSNVTSHTLEGSSWPDNSRGISLRLVFEIWCLVDKNADLGWNPDASSTKRIRHTAKLNMLRRGNVLINNDVLGNFAMQLCSHACMHRLRCIFHLDIPSSWLNLWLRVPIPEIKFQRRYR